MIWVHESSGDGDLVGWMVKPDRMRDYSCNLLHEVVDMLVL